MDDLFPEMRPRLSTDGKSEVMPEAPVVSSVHTGVTTAPVVDKQEEILKILQDIYTRIDASFENVKRYFLRMICFESNPQYFHIYRSSERYTGCFSCVKSLVHCSQGCQDLFLKNCTPWERPLQITKKSYFIPNLPTSIWMPEIPRPDQEDNQATGKVWSCFAYLSMFYSVHKSKLWCCVKVVTLVVFNNMLIKPNVNSITARGKFRLQFILKINVAYIFFEWLWNLYMC